MAQIVVDTNMRLLYHFLQRVRVSKELLIPDDVRREAWELYRDVDETDSPNIALTIHLNGRLWTGDKKLRAVLEEKGFNPFFDPPSIAKQ